MTVLLSGPLCSSVYIFKCLNAAALSSVAVKRNSLGSDLLFLGKSHPLFDFIHELYRAETLEVTEPNVPQLTVTKVKGYDSVLISDVNSPRLMQLRLLQGTEIPAELCHGIQGTLNLDDDPILPDK